MIRRPDDKAPPANSLGDRGWEAGEGFVQVCVIGVERRRGRPLSSISPDEKSGCISMPFVRRRSTYPGVLRTAATPGHLDRGRQPACRPFFPWRSLEARHRTAAACPGTLCRPLARVSHLRARPAAHRARRCAHERSRVAQAALFMTPARVPPDKLSRDSSERRARWARSARTLRPAW